jgi:hypothetical protein
MNNYYILNNPAQTDWENCNETLENATGSLDVSKFIVTSKDGCESYFNNMESYNEDEIYLIKYSPIFTDNIIFLDIFSKKQKEKNIEFGLSVINEFILENDDFDPEISFSESENLVDVMLRAKFYAEIGALDKCIVYLSGVTPITRILEQSRLNKYIEKIGNYINKFYNF